MSRGLEAGDRGRRRDAAPRELRIPGRLEGRRGLAGVPRSGGGGQRGQPWKDRPPPRPLGREGPRSGGQGCGRPFNMKACPATATSSASPSRPAGRPATAPGRMGKDEVEGLPVPRLPGTRQRVKGGPRDARRLSGRAPRAAIAPTPARTPAPAASWVQAVALQPDPHLISRRVCAATPGINQCSSFAAGRDAGASTPHTISPPAASPCVREFVRDSPSRAAVLRSNQAAIPPLSSALLYLLRSLPRSLSPAYLLISLGSLPHPYTPIHLLPLGVGTNSLPIGRRDPHLLTPTPPLSPPTAGKNKEDKMTAK